MNIAIIFAGGIGQRLNNELPKQFLEIDGKPILIYTLEHFQNHKKIDKIYIATLTSYIDYTKELIDKFNINKVASVVAGGSCAMESIYNALIAAKNENEGDSIVLIHDGVRPIINSEVIDNNIESVIKNGSAITTIPCNETIVESKDGSIAHHVPLRKETFKAQAPQSFKLKDVIEAHEAIKNDYTDIVDNCTLFMTLGKKVHLVEGNFGNIKITTPEDVYILKGVLEYIKTKKEALNV